jgi:hypothetical protein
MSITTEKLIENVKNYKILYDLSHPEYKNNRRKNKTWDEIGALLNTDGEYCYVINYAPETGPPCYRLQIRNVQGYNEQVVASTRFTMRTTRNDD